MRKFSLVIRILLYAYSDFGEHREISYVYMENTANLELFPVHKISAYIEKMPRNTKLLISQLVIKQILHVF